MISVCLASYNGEKYIVKCVESIENAMDWATKRLLNRNCEIGQILILNDGSTDATGIQCRELEQKYTNIKTFELNDEGVSAARNRGIDCSEGEYLVFVDADDVVAEDCFEKLLKVAEETDADIVGCGFYVRTGIDSSEDRPVPKHVDEYMLYTPQEYIDKQIILRNNSRCWSKLYRRDTVGEVRFDTGLTIGEDMVYLTECVKKSAKVAEMTEYRGYGYLLNATGAMQRPFTPGYMDQITCWERMSELTGLPLEAKKAIALMLIASKIAVGTPEDRNENWEYVSKIHEKLVRLLKDYPETLSKLDRGYRFKCKLFRSNPKLYLTVYHMWKK